MVSSPEELHTFPPTILTLEGNWICNSVNRSMGTILRGILVNRTYGEHKKPIYSSIFTNNIWSYLLLSSVIGMNRIFICRKTRLAFLQFCAKEPRPSESDSVPNRYLYRGSRLILNKNIYLEVLGRMLR